MMMKKSMAGRPGRPGRPGMAPKPSPQQQTFARNPSGTQFTNKPTQSNSGPMYGMKKGGKVKPKNMMDGNMAYSKGGSASSRADGCATKGKTKGKMV